MSAYVSLDFPADGCKTLVPVRAEDGACLWELRHFHHRIVDKPLGRWMKQECVPGEARHQRIARLAEELCPGLPATWVPSRKALLARGDAAAAEATAEASGTSGFLLGLLLLPHRLQNASAKRAAALSTLQSLLCAASADIGEIGVPGCAPCSVEAGGLFFSAEHAATDTWQELERLVASLPATRSYLGQLHARMPLSSFLVLVMLLRSCREPSLPLRDLAVALFGAVCHGLEALARRACHEMRRVPASDLVRCSLVSNAGKRRRLDSGISYRLSARHNIHQTVSVLNEDGGDDLSVETCELAKRRCSWYFDACRRGLLDVRCIEVAIDGARYSGRETNVGIVYSSDVELACYAPPQVHTHPTKQPLFPRNTGEGLATLADYSPHGTFYHRHCSASGPKTNAHRRFAPVTPLQTETFRRQLATAISQPQAVRLAATAASHQRKPHHCCSHHRRLHHPTSRHSSLSPHRHCWSNLPT
ncbi:MAG: hypothetical protein GY772_31710 [bacterium]|nr:hypothetical protein [bacterium]